MLTKITNNRSKWKFQLLRFISLIKSNAFWHYYCYIIAFLSIFATAIITISEDSNGASTKRTSRVPTYCLSDTENCDNLSCYIPRLSFNFHFMDSHWPILGHMALTKTKCTPIVIHYLTWSRHGGKCRDRRLEKHCQFSFSWMNTTTQTWSLKLKSNDFQSYPRRETAASGGKRCR